MLADVLKQLRMLPYEDMKNLAIELRNAMAGKAPQLNELIIADGLASVSKLEIADGIISTSDQKIMRELFRQRRSMSIKELNGGFQIELQTLHVSVLHRDLKIGVHQAIDTAVAARALRGS